MALHLHKQWYGNAPFNPEDRGSKPLTPQTPAVRWFAERNCSHTPAFYGGSEKDIVREAQRLCGLWNGQWSHHLNQVDVDALLKADRLWDFTRIPITLEQRELVKRRVRSGRCNSWLPYDNGYRPTAAEVNRWTILCPMGADAGPVISAECERLGHPTTCSQCAGEGCSWPSEEVKQQCENWKREEPPTGEAYQIWETVSEGSPISPPFLMPSALAAWMAIFYAQDGTHEQWLKFILGPGWAPSVVSIGGNVMSGVEAVCDMEDEPARRLSILDEAAVMGMKLIKSRKRMRKRVRQRRKTNDIYAEDKE